MWSRPVACPARRRTPDVAVAQVEFRRPVLLPSTVELRTRSGAAAGTCAHRPGSTRSGAGHAPAGQLAAAVIQGLASCSQVQVYRGWLQDANPWASGRKLPRRSLAGSDRLTLTGQNQVPAARRIACQLHRRRGSTGRRNSTSATPMSGARREEDRTGQAPLPCAMVPGIRTPWPPTGSGGRGWSPLTGRLAAEVGRQVPAGLGGAASVDVACSGALSRTTGPWPGRCSAAPAQLAVDARSLIRSTCGRAGGVQSCGGTQAQRLPRMTGEQLEAVRDVDRAGSASGNRAGPSGSPAAGRPGRAGRSRQDAVSRSRDRSTRRAPPRSHAGAGQLQVGSVVDRCGTRGPVRE